MYKEDVTQALENERALNALLRRLAGRSDLVPALEECLDIVLQVSWLSIEPRGGIFLTGADGRTLELVVDRGLDPPLRTICARVPFGRCLCGRAAASRAVQYASCIDGRHENRFPGMPPHGHYNVPILWGETVLGVMVLYLPQGHPRSEAEVMFLRSVADIVSLVIRQITSQGRLEDAHRELEMMANTDVLTGLPNRRFLLTRLEEETAEADRFDRPLAFLLMDIDHFKQVNDRHGHMAGDEVLRHVGRIIQANLRRYDIAARYGGEEFAIAFPNCERDAAHAVASRIRERLEEDGVELSDEETLRVTASFGLVARRPGEAIEDMIRRADEALYEAKNGGRNRVVCA